MKTKTILLIVLAVTLIASCKCKKKKKDEDINQLSLLPTLTNTGAETAGCLINGQAFLPYGYFPSGNLGCFYDGVDFGFHIVEKKNGTLRSVNIAILNDSLITGKSYSLTVYGPNSKYAEFVIKAAKNSSPDYYSTTDKVLGELIITHHNFKQGIMSGTFWFDAVNSNGEIMQIREGRFDVHYQ